MSSSFFGTFVDSAAGVSQIVVTVLIGAVGSWGVKDSQHVFKDFGFIITNVLVPSLFFTHMLASVTASLLLSSSILIFFSMLSVALGYFLSNIISRVVFPDSGFALTSIPRDAATVSVENMSTDESKEKLSVVIEYDPEAIGRYLSLPPGAASWSDVTHRQSIESALLDTLEAPKDTTSALRPNGYKCMLIIGSMIQNTFVLPLSLVDSLYHSSATFEWIDIEQTTAYIFFFNIVITIMFWTAGPVVVRSASKEHHRRVFAIAAVREHIKLRRCASTGTDTYNIREGAVVSPKSDVASCLPYWESVGGNHKISVRRKGYRQEESTEEGSASVVFLLLNSPKFRSSVAKSISPMINLPIIALFAGLILGLIPWTRWLFMEGPFTSIREPLALLGDGTVPAALLLLGANLTSNFSAVDDDEAAMRHFSHGPTEDVSALNHHRQLATEAFQRRTERPRELTLPPADEEERELQMIVEVRDEVTDATRTGAGGTGQLPPKTPRLVAYTDDPHIPDETEVIESWAASFADADRCLVDDLSTAPETTPTKVPGRSLASLFDTTGIDVRLLIAMCAIRLVVMPAVLFVLVHFTVASQAVESVADPQKNVLLLTLLVETSAPSAINTALLFSIYQFMTAEYSKCLLYQYTSSMLTMVLWLTVIISYTS